ncbi:unnamed protein product [Urochloa humidicola]
MAPLDLQRPWRRRQAEHSTAPTRSAHHPRTLHPVPSLLFASPRMQRPQQRQAMGPGGGGGRNNSAAAAAMRGEIKRWLPDWPLHPMAFSILRPLPSCLDCFLLWS